jgi:hypothetical protein
VAYQLYPYGELHLQTVYFDYEIETNDAKRNIIVLRPEFVPIAINELKNAFTMSI